MSSQLNLSAADVERLIHDPSVATREATAAKIAHAFQPEALSPAERQLAEEIFRMMLHDAEARVRRALSKNLKDNPAVPHDVALALAGDVAEVAVPMLESSAVLTEADLVAIIRSRPAEQQAAVARRHDLTEKVSETLVKTGDAMAVAALMRNEGAPLAEATLQKAVDRFGRDERVNASMVARAKLPVAVAERLVVLVSDRLRQHLVTHHELPPDIATDLVLDSRERATVGLTSGADQMDVRALVEQLHRHDRLTPTILLRALCTGDVDFFESAMAELAGIPVANAYRLIHEPGRLGLKRLYEHCGLPKALYPVVRAAVDVAQEMQIGGCGDDDRQRYVERMVERVLTKSEQGFEGENLDYLIGRLGRAAGAPDTSPPARPHLRTV